MQVYSEAQDIDQLRHISQEGLFHLGASDVVYVRPIQSAAGTVYALHSASGAPVTILESKGEAEIAATQNGMALVSVH